MSDNKSSYLEIAGKNKDFSEKMDKKLSVYDRRMDLCIYLSEVRISHYNELCEKYMVSRPTICKDLNFLEYELRVPIGREKGRYGKIYILDEWKVNRIQLSRSDEDVLYEIMLIIPEEYWGRVKSIIRRFGNVTFLKQWEKEHPMHDAAD